MRVILSKWNQKIGTPGAYEIPEIVEINGEHKHREIRQLLGGPGDVIYQEIKSSIYGEACKKQISPHQKEHHTSVYFQWHGSKVSGITRIDKVLREGFSACRYRKHRRDGNVWICQNCKRLEPFRSGGPDENGWTYCPGCGLRILPQKQEVAQNE